MAFDPSLTSSISQSILRSDHLSSHTPRTTDSDNSSLPIFPTTTSDQSHSSYMDSSQGQQDANSLNQPFISPILDQNGPSIIDEDAQVVPSAAMTLDVDPQIIEALKGKDRIYVLKLGETFEALITERRTRVELSAATSYQRLLVHRCSAYYKLAPESDPITKGIFVLSTSESRIPDRRICELVPAEATIQPAFKIMRRSVPERRSKPQSHGGSVAGEDADLSDVEPSEAGSLGGRSSANSSTNKKHRMTIEEREAAYNEARSRIFMDFEEKEKNKEKDMSASSSSLSLNGSASTSAGGRSNISDTDDGSSPATESEWSVPSGSHHSRDKKDSRRGGHNNGSGPSHRSLRNGGPFHGNGSGGSSRNSRAPSPSFSYASLHDAVPAGHLYDPSQPHLNQGMTYYPNQYAYPYSPPAQGPTPYMNPYPYFAPPYGLYPPPPPPPNSQHGPSDSSAASAPESYPPQQMNYSSYGWPQPPQQSIQSPHNIHMSLPSHPPPQNQPPMMSPPPSLHPQSPSHYPPYAPPPPPHAYSYPMNPYYPPPQQHLPPPGQPMHPPPSQINMQQAQLPHQPLHQQPSGGYDVPRTLNGNLMGQISNGQFNNNQNGNTPRPGLGNGIIPPNNNNSGRVPNRNVIGDGNVVNGAKNRGQLNVTGRSAWSYGPGVGNGGHHNANSHGETLGPRFQSPRHASGNSSSGGNSRSSTCDDVSSTSSSTTSSSSRRTFTSTTSSQQQHPLPPRPDWAVGLRAQPTLAASRHLDHNSRNNSPISPPRSSHGHNSPLSPNSNEESQRNGPVSLQSTDFPPLGGISPAEKKTPIAAGAWGQSRPVLSPGNSSSSTPPSAQQSPIAKQEDGVFNKSGEINNLKLVRRSQQQPVNGQNPVNQRAQASNKIDSAITVLAGQVSLMTFKGEDNGAAETSVSNDDAQALGSSTAVTSAPSV